MMNPTRYALVAAVLFAASLPHLAFAQLGKHYGGSGYQFGYRIVPTRDGGFVAAGVTDASDSLFEDYYAIRFDRYGNPRWESAYGRHGIYDFLWSVQPTHDNGSLLAGYSGAQFSGLEEALMYKIDSNGRVVKKLEVDYSSSDHAHWFAQTNDGHYYWAGHTDSKGDPMGDMICQRLDSNFKLIWEKTYDHGSAEHCHAGTIARDGGCMLIGHTSVNGHEKFFAVRNDTTGAVEWEKVYGSVDTLDDSPYDVINTFDGGFAFIGGSSETSGASQAWIVVVDSLGNRIMDHHFISGQTFAWSGIQASDSNFVVIGLTQDTTMNTQLYVAKITKDGTPVWQHSYGPGEGEGGYGIYQRGSQFVVTGEQVFAGTESSDLWILVLDSLGRPAPLDTLGNASVRSGAADAGLVLGNCFPNPARDGALIDLSIDHPDHLVLELVDETGRVLRTLLDGRVDVGRYFIRVDTRELSAGTYECRLHSAGGQLLTGKLVVVR